MTHDTNKLDPLQQNCKNIDSNKDFHVKFKYFFPWEDGGIFCFIQLFALFTECHVKNTAKNTLKNIKNIKKNCLTWKHIYSQ